MSNPLEKFTYVFTKEGRHAHEVVDEATAMIDSECNSLLMEIENVPDQRLPCVKIPLAIKHLKETVEKMMTSIRKTTEDLPEYQEILQVGDECKKVTLDHYIYLIPESEEVTPFATFHELQKNGQAEHPNYIAPLKNRLDKAVVALFTHPKFEQTLLEKLLVEVDALVQKCPIENDLERSNVIQFLEHFDEYRSCNDQLIQNPVLDSELQELKAVIFFQAQTKLLSENESSVAPDLAEHINRWTAYLSELSEAQQADKASLIKATDECSRIYNEHLS